MREAVELAPETTIPIISFADFTSGDTTTRMAAATSVRRALEEFGFLYLRDHGVPQSVVDELFARAQEFFALSPNAKARAAGYSPPGYRALDRFRWVVLSSGTLWPDDAGRRWVCAVVGARASGSRRPDGIGPSASSTVAASVADG